jgi:hypothetical protein
LTVKELKEELESYGDHMEVIVATVDGHREIDSVGGAPINIEDHKKDGMEGVIIFTTD